jgi:hypothetical protein
MKVLVLVWQDSQGSAVGKWFVGLLTTPADWLLWQVEQPLTMPGCLKFLTRKLVGLVWQVSHERVVWT